MRALVIVPVRSDDLTNPLGRVGVEVEVVPPLEGRLHKLRWAWRILTTDMRHVDVVISQGNGIIGFAATLAGHMHGCTTVARLRGDPWQEFEDQVRLGGKSRLKGAFDAWITRRTIRMVDRVVPVAHALGSRAIEQADCDPAKIVHVPVPAHCERFAAPPATGIPSEWDYPCLISLATLFNFYQKVAGVERFLPVLRAVVERYDAGVVIAGDGVHRKDFIEANRELLDHPAIHVPGYVDDMSALYRASDIFCHFSLLDGMPKVIQEAWCCGLPVVVNDYEPLKEHVVPEVNGYILPADAHVDACLPVFDRLITNPEHRRELGNNGQHYVQNELSLEKIGTLLIEAFEGARAHTRAIDLQQGRV